MIASLPMYWRAENAGAWRAFWNLVRDAHSGALPELIPPEALPDPLTEHWLSPDLCLSMTCGLPLRTALRGRVRYVGTFDFGLTRAAGYYHSQVVSRRGLAPGATGLRLAFNAPDSQSGWAAVDRPRGEFITLIETGSHAGSLAAVAGDRADIAWLDAVTWRLMQRHDPVAAAVDPVRVTVPTPGLPLITAADRDPAALRDALSAAVARTPADLRTELGGLRGFTVLDEALYHSQPVPPAPGA